MKKLLTLMFVALTLAGCAKTGRAWLMDNSPYWDMVFEGSPFHLAGFFIGGTCWWWLHDHWRFYGSRKPLLIGLVIVLVFSGVGLYRGYNYMNAPCSLEQHRDNACPDYKLKFRRDTFFGL